MANHWLLILDDLMMVVVHHQLKTYDLKANQDQP
jgi:hypothetical protein